MKSFYKKLVVLLAMVGVAVLGLSIIKPVNAAVTTPVVSNLKAQASGQKVIFSFDWDLTGKSVKEGDTFTIDAPEGVNISEVATQSLQANGAEVATITMTNKKITFTFKKAIESMNENVKGGFQYKAEWDNKPGNPGNKTATARVGSESVVITRPDGPGVFEAVLNKYNKTGDFVSKQFKLDVSENYAWMNVGDDYYLTTWFVRINGDAKKQALTNPVVSDKIKAPAVDYSKISFKPAANHAASEFFVGTYLKPSFTLRKGGQVVASGWDFWKHVKFDADGNGFTVNLSDVSDVFKTANSDEIIVEYQTLIPKTTIRVDNNATLKADEITTPQTDPAFWNNTELKFWVTGDKTVTVEKEWVGDSEADRKDITVQLMANGQKLEGMTKTLTKASGWSAEFSKLPGIKDGQPIVYSVVETNTPDGYTSKVEPINGSNVIKVVNTSNKPTTTTTTTTTTTAAPTTTSTTTASTTAATTTTESTTASTTAATTTTESTTASTTAATTTTESTTGSTTAATTTTESTTGSTTAATTTTESTTDSTTAATTTTESTTASTTAATTTTESTTASTTAATTTTESTTASTTAATTTTESTTGSTTAAATTTTTTTESTNVTPSTTTTTTPGEPENPGSTSTTEDEPGLPFTGEATGAALVFAGVVILSGAIIIKRKFTDK